MVDYFVRVPLELGLLRMPLDAIDWVLFAFEGGDELAALAVVVPGEDIIKGWQEAIAVPRLEVDAHLVIVHADVIVGHDLHDAVGGFSECFRAKGLSREVEGHRNVLRVVVGAKNVQVFAGDHSQELEPLAMAKEDEVVLFVSNGQVIEVLACVVERRVVQVRASTREQESIDLAEGKRELFLAGVVEHRYNLGPSGLCVLDV
mmetsp:Transcript_111933/g.156922  ORF Transcript_111933/g.156922 Transcript_111933/m.156922 type:complete len:203 (-) Transcript_111933:82-690(-)